MAEIQELYMVLEALGGLVSLSLGIIIGHLLTTLIIFIALVIADKIIAHEMEAKHILIMAFLCAFIVPIGISLISSILTSFIPAEFTGLFYAGMPLLFWIIFGEILLGGDYKEKIAVAFIAWAIYMVLLRFNISGIIMQFLPV